MRRLAVAAAAIAASACHPRTALDTDPVAFEPDDGWRALQTVWAKALPTMFAPQLCPIVADGSVFVSAGYGYGRFGKAHGEIAWWNTFPPARRPWVGDMALGLVDGALIVANSDDYAVSVDMRDGAVLAERRFERRTWGAASPYDEAGRQNGHYWIFDQSYRTTDDGAADNRLIAVGPDLEPVITIPAPGMAEARPMLDGDDGLLVSFDFKRLVALDASYAHERWRVETFVAGSTLSLDRATLYDLQTKADDFYGPRTPRAFHTADGALLWKLDPIPGAGSRIAGDGVFVAAHWRTTGGYQFVKDDTVVWRFDSETGELLGTTNLPPHPSLISPFARTPDGLLFTTHGDGYFVIDEADGSVVRAASFHRPEDWEDWGSAVQTLCAPVLIDEGILVQTYDGIAVLPYPDGIGMEGRR